MKRTWHGKKVLLDIIHCYRKKYCNVLEHFHNKLPNYIREDKYYYLVLFFISLYEHELNKYHTVIITMV